VRLPAILRAVARRPRESMLAIAGAGGIAAIVVNALFLQPGPHPAPIFALSPPAAAAAANTAPASSRPRGPVAEIVRTEPPARQHMEIIAAPQGARSVAARRDPIAGLIASSRQLASVQRALSDFGYGPLETNGVLGPGTRAAIERFERDRKMPITGQMSERLSRELAAMTGKPL
jgi:hypothetical protein